MSPPGSPRTTPVRESNWCRIRETVAHTSRCTSLFVAKVQKLINSIVSQYTHLVGRLVCDTPRRASPLLNHTSILPVLSPPHTTPPPLLLTIWSLGGGLGLEEATTRVHIPIAALLILEGSGYLIQVAWGHLLKVEPRPPVTYSSTRVQ